jgi:hypothetical protein
MDVTVKVLSIVTAPAEFVHDLKFKKASLLDSTPCDLSKRLLLVNNQVT